MFKATAAVYNVLTFWELIPETPELLWISLDIKHFNLVVSEKNEN